MSGDRFAYYFKTILNSSLEDIQEIAYQFENDRNISIGEAQELERMLEKHQEMFKPPDVYVVNASTGNEELPPKTEIDNFGNSSVYVGSERAFESGDYSKAREIQINKIVPLLEKTNVSRFPSGYYRAFYEKFNLRGGYRSPMTAPKK